MARKTKPPSGAALPWHDFSKLLAEHLDELQPSALERAEVERLAHSAYTADPQNASLWKEYLAARRALTPADGGGADVFAQIAEAYSAS